MGGGKSKTGRTTRAGGKATFARHRPMAQERDPSNAWLGSIGARWRRTGSIGNRPSGAATETIKSERTKINRRPKPHAPFRQDLADRRCKLESMT